jgi:hypothetical protein
LAANSSGAPPPKFTLPERREIKKAALSRPVGHDLPFATWTLSKLAEFVVAKVWSTTSATRVPRVLLSAEGVSFR